MECMRVLFAACDAMTNYGAEVGDAALCRIGQEYAACVLATDLATIHSVRRVFKPRGSFWVLEDTVTMGIVGTIALQDLGGGVGEMRRVCVSARYRRRGLAQALVAHLQRAALALGLTKVIMSTPVLNAPAIAMYSRCGFQETVRFPAAGLPVGTSLELVEMAWHVAERGVEAAVDSRPLSLGTPLGTPLDTPSLIPVSHSGPAPCAPSLQVLGVASALGGLATEGSASACPPTLLAS